MTKKARAHVVIFGKVQGVCFRMETKQAAEQFGVSGWVMNKSNGTVEAVFEGNKNMVDSIINWCRKGPPFSAVKNVDVVWKDYKGEFIRFEITY